MSSSTSFSVLIAIIIVAVIALSKLRKTFRGWKVKRKPIFVITMIYLGLTCFFAVTSFLIGIPFLYLIVYLAEFIILSLFHIVTLTVRYHSGKHLMVPFIRRVDCLSRCIHSISCLTFCNISCLHWISIISISDRSL